MADIPHSDSPKSDSGIVADPETQQVSQPRRPIADAELKPLARQSLNDAIREDLHYVKNRAAGHDLRAARWDVVAGWSRLVVALSAAISSVSLLASNRGVTAAFSILTAAMAALTAAFKPSESAVAHRGAAKEYNGIRRQLSLLLRRFGPLDRADEETPSTGTYQYYDYESDSHEPEDLGRIYQTFIDYRAEIDTADDRAPPINKLRKQRAESFSSEPWTRRRVRRYERALKNAAAAESVRVKYARSTSTSDTPDLPAAGGYGAPGNPSFE